MTKNNSVVAIFKSHIEAETAVKELQQPLPRCTIGQCR